MDSNEFKSTESFVNWLRYSLLESIPNDNKLELKGSSTNYTLPLTLIFSGGQNNVGENLLEGLQGMAERLNYFHSKYYELLRESEKWKNIPKYNEDIIEVNNLRGKVTQDIIDDLIDKYNKNNQYHAFVNRKDRNYFKLLAFGKEIIPFLITKIKKDPDWICLDLLFAIEKIDVPKDHIGRFYLLVQDWIDWYENNSSGF